MIFSLTFDVVRSIKAVCPKNLATMIRRVCTLLQRSTL